MTMTKKTSDLTKLAFLYAPDFQLDGETEEQLTSILYEQQLVEEPENPTIVCAWTSSDEHGLQMDVALYLNGGDSEEGGFLFYRRSTDPSGDIQKAVSIPGAWHQAWLRKFCGWQHHSERQKLYEQLTRVAQRILKNTSAWVSLLERGGSQR